MRASEHHRVVGFVKCVLEVEARKEDGTRGRSLKSMLRKGHLLHYDVTEPKKVKGPLRVVSSALYVRA